MGDGGNTDSYLKQFTKGVTEVNIVCTDVSALWAFVVERLMTKTKLLPSDLQLYRFLS